MSLTNYMGLTAWDLGGDQFNYGQMADNFEAIDDHDHSPSKGKQITSAGLADNAVTTTKIINAAITASKYAPGSVNQVALAKPSVGTPELYDGAVTAIKIADGSIGPTKLDPNMIPLGQCILWLRADPSVSLPGGVWEPLDGRAWSSVTNLMGPGATQLNTGNMPDTRNAFVLGAALTGTGTGPSTPPAIGSAGGSMTSNLAHSHAVAGHAHTVADHVHSVPDHNHAIASDGSHNHNMYSRQTRTLRQDETGNDSYLQTLYVSGFNTGGGNALVPFSGAHSHGGATGAASAGLVTNGSSIGTSSTSSNGSTTDSQLGSVDTRPKFVGFLILCRVR